MASVWGLVVWWRRRRPRRRIEVLESKPARNLEIDELRDRLRLLVARIPERRSLTHCEFPPIDASATIEAWLLQKKPRNALAAATIAARGAPNDWRVHLHLARTLFYCDEMEAAARELVKARLLGDTSPAQDYLEARIRLGSTRWWSAENDELGVEDEQRMREESAEALKMLLGVAERDPSFGDASYHAARLAVRMGLAQEGLALLRRVKPLMEGSPEREHYLSDVRRFDAGRDSRQTLRSLGS